MSEQKKKIAIVTGAAQGIGKAIAKELVSLKVHVALLDKEEGVLFKTNHEFSEVNTGSKTVAIACDVSRKEEVDRAITKVERQLGPVQILINNAGVGGPFHTIDQVSEAEWDLIFNTNVRSLFLLCQNLLPKMQKIGFGRIINIASIQGLIGAPRSSTYVASKHAVIGYTRAIAAEWGQYGITCNAICPGYVQTRMGVQTEQVKNHYQQVIGRTPCRRLAQPEEIAYWVGSILHERSSYLNGAVIVTDGGITAHAGIE